MSAVNDNGNRCSSSEEDEIEALKEQLFLAKLEVSRPEETSIPTGHSDAYHGGAIYDDVRHQIVSVSRESNRGRDVFVTRLRDATHGSTTYRPNVIPFDTVYRIPVYDGDRYVYFTERTIEDNGAMKIGRRFGRLDLETFLFEELSPLPADPFKGFAYGFRGCYLDGVVYYADCNKELCGYNVADDRWSPFKVPLPLVGANLWGGLLSDPKDKTHLYYLGYQPNKDLCQIDLTAHTCTALCAFPAPHDVYDSVLIHPRSDSRDFIIISEFCGHPSWMYSSKKNSWTALPKWNSSNADCLRNFLVYVPSLKAFYKHVHGKITWDVIQVEEKP